MWDTHFPVCCQCSWQDRGKEAFLKITLIGEGSFSGVAEAGSSLVGQDSFVSCFNGTDPTPTASLLLDFAS